ncbi:MAG: hypothetical protein WAO24_01630 [Peptococcia bacterium]
MMVYHGTNKNNANNIKKYGIQLNNDSLNINNKGYGSYINAFFVTPNADIAHIYESDHNKNNSVMIEFDLNNNSNILDLTAEENQNKLIDYLENNKNNTVNDYLIENDFDGCKQIHKNDFGLNRLEYAIVNKNMLNLNKITKTKFMSLYNEATQEIDLNDYI